LAAGEFEMSSTKETPWPNAAVAGMTNMEKRAKALRIKPISSMLNVKRVLMRYFNLVSSFWQAAFLPFQTPYEQLH
jgi:hypothetical protein